MDILIDLLLTLYGPAPYLVVFGILLLCGFGLPIPEDITLIAGGVMAYYGVCNLEIMIVVGFVGVMLGDSAMYFLGAHYGRRLTQRWFFAKVLPPERLNRVSHEFNTRGDKLLFFARFMPGLRAPIYFSAGVLHIPFKKFFFYDGMAAILSVPVIIGAVYYFGDHLDHTVRLIQRVEGGILGVIIAIILFVGFKVYRNRSKKNEKP